MLIALKSIGKKAGKAPTVSAPASASAGRNDVKVYGMTRLYDVLSICYWLAPVGIKERSDD